MARIVDLFRDTAPSAPYDDVARREAYAQALRQSAARPRGPAPGGRVQAKFGIGEGLTQLAEALLARYAGKQAIEARNAADEQTRVQNEGVINDLTADPRPQKLDQNMQPIAGTEPQQLLDIDTGRPELSQRGKALQLALSGMPPQQVQQMLAGQQVARLLPPPSEVADRELRRAQIEGGLRDRRDAREQRLFELEMRLQDRGLDRDARARMESDARALRAQIAQGQQATQRAIADQADATRRAELDRKIEADKKTAPNATTTESADAFLSGINFDQATGQDDVTKLLSEASGGVLQAVRDTAGRAFNYATEGAKASQSLKSRASEAVLNFLGGKLGAGVSNADRDFMMQRAGDIGNEYLSSDERLAAWRDVRQRMIDASKRPQAPPEAPSLPPTNHKGWRLMTDKNGVSAYVSSDGTQFEEVR